MANFRKNEEYVCPHCSKSDHIECYDTEIGCEYMVQKICCTACDIDWREYFRVEYDGYAADGKEYDKDGNEVN